MNKMITSLNAVLAGFGGAFAIFPTGQIEQFIKREPVEARMQANFARAGMRMEVAIRKVKDEAKASQQT
ncbi:TPA: hypothetical protein ACKPW3_001675 [Stenotrophomonas maltophilia]|uniref:hypothetical protein n=1 Tax=Stenotrophomonas maltophilia TaxID=40324 RepID=UPI00117D7790|nr:hypothetical protein [Stenotrophomonas maltophilia]MBH1523639.1 hypothetical protein [Stenotrophomonas maltophilia]MBH1648659.1 hypothetical protein [Stenotrophomonas maltophilia]MBH1754154.1 hypothetical protein [Stenotrophomonas maltophilia]MBH1811763.1 hypothetical protein [Stenotrophomonas maltophilia]MBH1889625.1 hypothetical protein [Stenotrophomonas maltophilia]